jgi:general secretion pathway protein N
MKRHSLWSWCGGLLGVVVALVAFAPASWLASSIGMVSQGRVLLQEPRGTVWAGSAQLVLAGGDGSSGATRLPSRMNWDISPQWWGVTVLLSAPCCTPATPVQMTALLDEVLEGGALAWTLRSSELALPASMLVGLGAPWNTLQLAGDLRFSTDRLAGQWTASGGVSSVSGQALLQANHMTTALSTLHPLGSYKLSTAGKALRLETNGEAALVLNGTGNIEQGRIAFLGEATAAKGREEALSNLLHMMGQWQPNNDGRMSSILKI